MLNELTAELDTCQLADSHRLARKIRDLQKSAASKHSQQAHGQAIEKLRLEISASQQLVATRSRSIPAQINYPPELPVSGSNEEIAELIRSNQVVVVAGDTGSGKTTQLPKICLDAGLGRRGLIGHTQPRRLAAVSVATRIAEELGTETGQGVGYQVRFNEQVSPKTYLKLMTDGILLAEIQRDRFLNRYEVIIIDEAHERSLNIDFLLGFLKQLLAKRRDLKLIITSATIDVEKFSSHFNDAPIVSVSGRTYPVETHYRPLEVTQDDSNEEDNQFTGILSALQEIVAIDRKQNQLSGDVLVFLSSEREIRDTANKLRKQKLANTEVLPLYSRLRHSEQLKVFRTHKGRRIVLSTNVAETSLTVPGINYVIDTGFARISRYSIQSKVQRLPIEAVSQASANQRKGRCGRLANGVCYRLYSEEDFIGRPEFTDPEIRRTNLASVILRMKFLRLGSVEEFPFLEPPAQKAVNEGFKLLSELHAISPSHDLTDCGRQMASFAVDPRHARMIVIANEQRCLREILIIAAALSIQDPRDFSFENKQQALEKLARFKHADSDFLGFVQLWDQYEVERQNLSQAGLRKFCKNHSLSFIRMREWREVHRQLLLSAQALGFRLNKEDADYQGVHQAIIGGSLNQIACNSSGRLYQGSRNKIFTLFSPSVLSNSSAKWIVTGPLIETSQTFATLAAKIQPEWIEQMALHLLKRNYDEPHWSKKRQQVMAYEKVILYGLVIIERSLVAFANIDIDKSREIFLAEGLLEQQLNTNAWFYSQNLKFLADLSKQEDKIRRPDFMLSDREVLRFYERQIPEHIVSTTELERWFKLESKKNPGLLKMSMQSFEDAGADIPDLHAYPDSAAIQQNQLSVDYVFNPGTIEDGATIEVPLAILNQLSSADVDWAVPGMLNEKCIALIKGLPKALRKNFIPVSGFVEEATQQMTAADGDIIDSLRAQIYRLKKLELSRDEFRNISLSAHLLVKIRVLSQAGAELAFGNDLEQLKAQLNCESTDEPSSPSQVQFNHALEKSGLTDWDFDELPQQLEIGDELILIRYPSLVDKGDTVSVELLANEAEARRVNHLGLLRLCMLRSVQQRNAVKKKLNRFVNDKALKLPKSLLKMEPDALQAVYDAAFDLDSGCPRSRKEFDAMLERGKSRLVLIADELLQLISKILDETFAISRALSGVSSPALRYARDDMENQLAALLYENCLSENGLHWLREYPRYLKAMRARLEKVPHMGDKDKAYTEEFSAFWSRYTKLRGANSIAENTELKKLRWMLEEYRVSVFAQSLGTSLPVSAKRVNKQFDLVTK